MANFIISQLDALPSLPCPCGTTQRGFVDVPTSLASVHYVHIMENAATHYHKSQTEIYIVLEGKGEIELDGTKFPIQPLTSILIQPGCRHRALGNLKILNISIPRFNPEDEWFD